MGLSETSFIEPSHSKVKAGSVTLSGIAVKMRELACTLSSLHDCMTHDLPGRQTIILPMSQEVGTRHRVSTYLPR